MSARHPASQLARHLVQLATRAANRQNNKQKIASQLYLNRSVCRGSHICARILADSCGLSIKAAIHVAAYYSASGGRRKRGMELGKEEVV